MSDLGPSETEPALDTDARAMLDAFAAEERIPSEVHERVWARVAADVARPAAPKWPRRALLVSGLVAAAAVAMMWTGARSLRPADQRDRANQAEYGRQGSDHREALEPGRPRSQSTRAPVPGSNPAPSDGPQSATSETPLAEPEPPTPPSSEPTRTDSADSDGKSEPRRSTGTSSREPSPTDEPDPTTASATLLDELEIIRRANTELTAEHPERALAALDEHARRFPSGALTEERRFLRAVALCKAGRDDEGKERARAFLQTYPRTAFAERLRSACLE
ncbi:hypothetical protein [Paraliomyxa miuraensis]|uniref:hypothetical protein n=1 Tax=Paraliomyxa miuraensis TaxID=376150 RepID=UPI0022546EC5|nr:hypothetical protein [Paraliomyxa miuraensis]MCX4246183.1 hypothetical protein [Paraliomyxa miuraensis]